MFSTQDVLWTFVIVTVPTIFGFLFLFSLFFSDRKKKAAPGVEKTPNKALWGSPARTLDDPIPCQTWFLKGAGTVTIYRIQGDVVYFTPKNEVLAYPVPKEIFLKNARLME